VATKEMRFPRERVVVDTGRSHSRMNLERENSTRRPQKFRLTEDVSMLEMAPPLL
jgi:hypothetical protein